MKKQYRLTNNNGEQYVFTNLRTATRFCGVTTNDAVDALMAGTTCGGYFGEYSYAELPISGYGLEKPMSFDNTPWGDTCVAEATPGVETNKLDKNRILLLKDIYDRGMGMRSAIAHGLFEHSDELFERPTNNVASTIEVNNIAYDDGTNILDLTLQELVEYTGGKLNWYVLECMLNGNYHGHNIQMSNIMRAAIIQYQHKFMEDKNDPNREI